MGRSGLGIGVDVLLQEPGGQILSEFVGPLFALIEGDELVLERRIEHQVKGGGGLLEPATTQFLTSGVRSGGGVVH